MTGGNWINLIRTFAGRDVRVWGERILAGNDNEWCYILGRRFLNMVEESVEKSTEFAVFEPNDAPLIQQWRDGALQGSGSEDAFFVNVGLGKTMTALDKLEGRMVVEIGMAAVQPAEFIILRFIHKLPEA